MYTPRKLVPGCTCGWDGRVEGQAGGQAGRQAAPVTVQRRTNMACGIAVVVAFLCVVVACDAREQNITMQRPVLDEEEDEEH